MDTVSSLTHLSGTIFTDGDRYHMAGTHLAAEGIHATLHTQPDDEDYAEAEVPYLLVVYFYSEMAMLGVVANGSMIIALSRLRPTIETLRSIGQV